MQATELTIKLPDLPSLTPFSWAGCNPSYCPSDSSSTEWMFSYGIFSDRKRARLDKTKIELLGAYTYPYADADGLRLANDLLTIITTLDDFTDEQDTEGAKATRDTFVKALTDDSCEDNSPITLFTKDFLKRISHIPHELKQKVVTHFIEYIDATAEEATLRTDDKVPSFEEYIAVRRLNGAIFPCYDFVEILLGIVLPPEVFKEADIQNMILAANDLMSISNDIYSFTKEYSLGIDYFNSVTVLMYNEGLSYQEAMDRAGEIYKSCADTFMACKASLRSFGEDIDKMIHAYICGLEQWVCGNNAWYLDTERYFGKDREEVKRTGIVRLCTNKN